MHYDIDGSIIGAKYSEVSVDISGHKFYIAIEETSSPGVFKIADGTFTAIESPSESPST